VGKRYSSLEVTTSDRQELIARVDVHNIEVLFLSSDPDVRPSCGLVVLRRAERCLDVFCEGMLLDFSNHNLSLSLRNCCSTSLTERFPPQRGRHFYVVVIRQNQSGLCYPHTSSGCQPTSSPVDT